MPKTYAESLIGNHHGRWISQSIRFWLPVPVRKARKLHSLSIYVPSIPNVRST